MSNVVTKVVRTPVGDIVLAASDEALVEVRFEEMTSSVRASGRPSRGPHAVLDLAERELHDYFERSRTRFTVPRTAEGTPFQKLVWDALSEIPYGETRTYAEIARAIGRPSAVRAVGAANRDNPFAVLVPCHRVIGSGGDLTGYAGGLPRKRWLLDHESRSRA